ncbi:hypothetical protein PC128_g5908 [Phytophthora cactorum]|nr:hypothetical protein C6341_g12353 [Phytophthora cactorum]KAG3198609.1 hypothetical protein PC128_g5908 [Phytophthora cactorum]
MPTQPHRLSHLLNPLQCTEQDNTMLIELAETLVVHNIEQFSALELGKNGAPANKNRWKEVKKKEGTKIFMEKAIKVSGERIGYHLTHSVGFEQSTASTVQMYVRGFFDLNDDKNELGNRATMNGIASHWMSYSRKVECAQVKKLLWTMHKNDNRESILSLKDDGELSVVASTPGLCKICSKSFGFLGTSRKFCNVCNEQCITDVTNTDALRITSEEILNGGKQVAAYY